MNESDVREELVRPLITRLGYQHGTDTYVRTEVPLKYEQAFLGRRNPSRDPILRGRADYVCGVAAAGRWVIEVKAPDQDLTEEVVQQAHTYAAHPEIAAYYFAVSNGRRFKVFETGRLDDPLLDWAFDETEKTFLRVLNLLGPDAIRTRSKLVLADPQEPLGVGLRSKLHVMRGVFTCDSIEAGGLNGLLSPLRDLEIPLTNGEVCRDAIGRIHASVNFARLSPLIGPATNNGFSDHYDFFSSSEYISIDEERPTIFENLIDTNIFQGSPTTMMGKAGVMPFGFRFKAFTETIGFVREGVFQGTVRIEGDMTIGQMNPLYASVIRAQFGVVPGHYRVIQSGRFHAELIAAS